MLKLYFTITVKDKNGKVKRSNKNRCSHSFTKQFLQYFEGFVTHRYGTAEGQCSLKDTSNTARTMGPCSYYGNQHWALVAGVATSPYGIVVGTGSNAESVSDYALQTQCAEGSGASQFQHSAVTYVTSLVSGSDVFFSLIRTFQNASGNTITINEIGLYLASNDTAGTVRFICIVRDLLGAGVNVLNGEICTVQYTFKTTN